MNLLIDNYDSFSYNLYQYIGEIDPDITVIRNDAHSVDEIRAMKPAHVILSPGPGRPEDAGVTVDVAKNLGNDIPILGVCLGHQAICAAFGGVVTHASRLMHGKQSVVRLDTDTLLFSGCSEETPVARYHSLALDRKTLPDDLQIIAETAEGEVMAVMHRTRPIYGVQFHPESILTPEGRTLLGNFLRKL